MPNSSLPQDQDGQDLFNAISSFLGQSFLVWGEHMSVLPG